MIRILIISPTQSGIGGIAQYVQGLANFLKKTGHDELAAGCAKNQMFHEASQALT